MSVKSFFLHLHPPRVDARTLRFSYTFGLGGAAVLLVLVQVVTGALLMFAYRPTPEAAYLSIVALQTEVQFGQLLRNLHHWSANLLVVVVGLHLLRVFYTTAFRGRHAANWQWGLGLLGLTLAANFTGYLLPWDQLAYWAVTVGASLLSYIPLVGDGLRQWLLGGPDVSDITLNNFYTLHVMAAPLGLLAAGMVHIWHVRKDKFSTPRRAGEAVTPPARRVTAVPHLVGREVVFALVLLALLLAWATWANAPLLQAADPNHPPDPAKAAWYFAGVQELLFHFHPTFGAFVIPALGIGALVTLPFLRDDQDSTGIWFRSARGWRLVVISLLLGAAGSAGFVWFNTATVTLNGPSLLPDVVGRGVLPLGVILLALWGYARLLRRFGATPGEARMAIFTLLLAAFLVLTLVGATLRGPGMALQLPGALP